MNKPLYTAVAAITLDGKIARNSKHHSSWTSREDKVFLHKILDKCGVAKRGLGQIIMVLDKLQWNVDLDADEFRLNIPSDYTVIEE